MARCSRALPAALLAAGALLGCSDEQVTCTCTTFSMTADTVITRLPTETCAAITPPEGFDRCFADNEESITAPFDGDLTISYRRLDGVAFPWDSLATVPGPTRSTGPSRWPHGDGSVPPPARPAGRDGAMGRADERP